MHGVRGPAIRAVMEHRLLISYRIEPDVLRAVLPVWFRPALAGGYGVGSICLIGLTGIRPGLAGVRPSPSGVRPSPSGVRPGRAGVRPGGLFPAAFGLRAQNVAHRIAVVLDTADGPADSVYIPVRYTSSRLAACTGGLLFPRLGTARFHASEQDGRYQITAQSADGATRVAVDAQRAASLPAGSVFADLDEASSFFLLAPVGYSPASLPGVFDRVKLDVSYRELHPLRLDTVTSSFFDDPGLFPPGTATLDSAFAATGLATWQLLPQLRIDQAVPAGRP